MPLYADQSCVSGHTPMVMLPRFGEGAVGRIAAKLEWMNPSGSVKDRTARALVQAAETRGELKPGGTVVAVTSGSLGISLASLCAAKGYRLLLTAPGGMSAERLQLLKALGAQVFRTPTDRGMPGASALAEVLCQQHEDAVLLDQFSDPANPRVHEETTGVEIREDTQGVPICFVAGVGTGGTLTGVARALKECCEAVHIVAVEPADSPVLSGGKTGMHGIQGIGAGFVPPVMDMAVVDEIVTVTQRQAEAAVRRLARTEGLLAGISSGAALHAAYKTASRREFADRLVVTLLPDSGERYLSTGLFEENAD